MKRVFDLAIALIVVTLLTIPIVLIALCVRFKLGSPVLFKQQRPGLHGRPFHMIKFRTMVDTRDTAGALLPDADRLPPFGAWLRASSLDELPGLFNVLKGDMSLVGPRPLLMQYVPLYTPLQSRRHEVRPGITGWAQVNGRNTLNWEKKFEHDIWYVDHQSFWLDIKILLLTAKKVLKRDGINAAGEATMPAFLGNEIDERPRPK
ncbi:sugar transferase [Sphingomonas sp. 2SG]|uniref:sugar transferase n=1 Tax=Sphingomonas sp. 2SG TaxID=2502201 RepID=UPI0024B49056|nr:sugar transferase [Sphingomonas sp. 2SG]